MSAYLPCELDSAWTAEADTRDFGEHSGVRHPVNSLRLFFSPSAPSLTRSFAPSGKVLIAETLSMLLFGFFLCTSLFNGLLPNATPRGRKIWILTWHRLWK